MHQFNLMTLAGSDLYLFSTHITRTKIIVLVAVAIAAAVAAVVWFVRRRQQHHA